MCPNSFWINDNKGGGGGGGGGALVIVALGKIIVGPTGHIRANGGDGGGGEQAGGNNQGAGGGGGSGGMVILYSANSIELHTHGETYANNDYDSCISADGGVGLQGRFGGTEIRSKYPPPAVGSAWDQNPTGALGGLGIIQLMTPYGTNNDGTNTHFDDNIHVIRGSTRLIGKEKKRYLAWRGYPDASGQWLDDFGQPTNIGDNEGDMRPTPKLLPILN